MQPFAPEHMPLASSAGMHVEQRFPEIGFGQKLDQVVPPIREQVSETASIKEERCSLRSEMNELKQNSKIITESVSSSTASTPVAAVKKGRSKCVRPWWDHCNDGLTVLARCVRPFACPFAHRTHNTTVYRSYPSRPATNRACARYNYIHYNRYYVIINHGIN